MSSSFMPATACVRVSLFFFFFFLRLNNIPVYSLHPLWGLRGLVSWWRWLGCVWHPTPDRTYGKSHGLRAPTCQTAASHSVGPFSLLSTPAPLGSPRETSAPLSRHREGLLGWEVPLGVPWTLSEAKHVWFFCKQGLCLFWGGGNVVCYSTEMIKRGAKGSCKGKYLLWSGNSFSFLNVVIEYIFFFKSTYTSLDK